MPAKNAEKREKSEGVSNGVGGTRCFAVGGWMSRWETAAVLLIGGVDPPSRSGAVEASDQADDEGRRREEGDDGEKDGEGFPRVVIRRGRFVVEFARGAAADFRTADTPARI